MVPITFHPCINDNAILLQQVFEEDGAEESQEDAVEVEAEGSTDGTIHVNGNDSEEQWGTNKEEPSA